MHQDKHLQRRRILDSLLGDAHPFERAVLRALTSRTAWRPDVPVLAAVSGGPDSVALALALRGIGAPVELAYFDHQTRAGESREDGEFVRALAGRLGVPFHVSGAPVAEEAADLGRSFEDYARERRYAFLCETAHARGIGFIATGHHADDQAETVLLRLLRGAAGRGLAGIPPEREHEGVRIIRPLLTMWRTEVLAYLGDCGEPYRTDSSNDSRDYTRNRIRHDLIPLLEREYAKGLRESLVHLATIQHDENDWINLQVRAAMATCIDSEGHIVRAIFAALHRALARRLLQGWCEDRGIRELGRRTPEAVEAVRSARTGTKFDLGEGWVLQISAEKAILLERGRPDVFSEHPEPAPLTAPVLGTSFRVREYDVGPDRDWKAFCSPNRQVLDAAAVRFPLMVRTRQRGDRLKPLGSSGTRKLQDIFSDLKLTQRERSRQLMIVSGDDIVWIVGRMVASEYAVGPDTKRIMEIEVSDETEQNTPD